MKKRSFWQMSVFLCLLLILGMIAPLSAWAEGDEYTPSLTKNANGEYEISTAVELESFRQDLVATGSTGYLNETVVLTDDIEIGEESSLSIISGRFYGTFDGQEHKITLNNQEICYKGAIINNNYGTIRNVTVIVNDGTTKTESGSARAPLCGSNYGRIEFVKVEGNIKIAAANSKSIQVAGIAGTDGLAGNIIENSISSIDYTLDGTAEEIEAYKTRSQSVYLYQFYVSGRGDLDKCYSLGKVTNTDFLKPTASSGNVSIGLAVYTNGDGQGKVYYNNENLTPETIFGKANSDKDPVDHVFGKSAEDMKKEATFDGWEFNKIWSIASDVDEGYPHLDIRTTFVRLKVKPVFGEEKVWNDQNDLTAKVTGMEFVDLSESEKALVEKYNITINFNPETDVNSASFKSMQNLGWRDVTVVYNNQPTITVNKPDEAEPDKYTFLMGGVVTGQGRIVDNGTPGPDADEQQALINKAKEANTIIFEKYIGDGSSYLQSFTNNEESGVQGEWEFSQDLWAMFSAARGGYYPGGDQEFYDKWFANVKTGLHAMKEKGVTAEDMKYTAWAKLVLAITASGYDARDIEDYDLIGILSDKNMLEKSLILQENTALLALEGGGYELTAENPIVDLNIYGQSMADSLNSYPDAAVCNGDNAMFFQQMCFFMDEENVKTAVENYMYNRVGGDNPILQNGDGSFTTTGCALNAYNNAQVMIALGCFDMSVFDDRFIQNGNTVLDAQFNFINFDNRTYKGTYEITQLTRGFTAVIRQYEGSSMIFDTSDIDGATKPVNDMLIALNSESTTDEINAAKAAYDKLSDAKKASIKSENLAKIDVDEATQAVIDAITALPAADTITLDNEAAVTAARSAYKALTDVQKKLVNADLVAKLEAAEAAIDSLKPDSGTVTIDVERFTIGQGFFKEPVTMAYTKGDTVMDLLKKLVGEDNIVGSSSNVSGIKGADLGTATIPDYITNNLKGPSTDKANEAGCKDTDVLAAGDYDTLYGYVTGWMYLVNDEIPNITANDYVVQDGDVIRWAFTVWGYGADLDGVGMGGFGLEPIEIASRDVLLKVLAAVNSADNRDTLLENTDVKTAYDNALVVVADMTKTTDQTQAAADALTQAVLAANGGSAADQQAADAVTALIAKLPKTVTLENATAVAEARTAYDALTGDQQKLVTNLSILTAAETKIAELNSAANQAAADTVKAKITALPATDKLTLVDKSTVTAARAAYTALTADQQKLVTNLSTLTAAEAKITALEQAVIDQEKADAVTASITALPATTAMSLSDQAKVEAARTAYNALSDVQKKLVTNLSTLTAAETKIAELVKAQTKTITIDVERFTIGQGFYVEPVTLSITDGMTARQAIEKQLGADNLVGEVGYLRAVVGADTGSVAIPDYIVDTLGGGDTDTAMAYGQKYTGNTLGEFDYSHDSGWMYLVNNETPNVGMNAYTLEDGDVLRLAFTYCGYGEDLTGLEYGSNKVLVSIANKDNLLKQIAVVNGDKTAYLEDEAVKTAYNTAMTVVSNMTATQKATNDAASALATAIAAFVPDDDDQTLADAVTAKIAALPAVDALKLANKSSVTAARAAYNSLTETQKALVTNLSTLVAAEAKIKALEADAPVAIDKATGIEMIGFDEGVDLLVGDLSDDKDVQAAALKAAEEKGLTNSAILALYNIKPDLSVKDLEAFNSDPDATAVLTIPIPEDQQGFDSYLIYHLKENGEVEWLTPVVSEDGKSLSVTVSQFSTFAIVVEDDAPAPDPDVPTISYQTHVQNVGWQREKTNGALSGTEGQGLRLEGIRINVGTDDLGVSYQTQIENIGWQETKYDGDLSGTEGQGLRLEGIRINLTGDDADQYDIYYRVHAQNFGWMDWAKNGQDAGTEGFGDRLEAIEIKLVKKDGAAPGETACPFATNNISVSYQTQIQNVGWQGTRSCGALSGTEGQGLRLEGIKINLDTSGYDVGVTYQTQIENVGWQEEVSNGDLSGTVGQSLRLEGIKINLTGEDADLCDIYYQVHAQNVGWMGWAKNGEAAGTEGFGYRLEGIRIVVVPKGQAAPGSTANAFTSSH